MDWQEVANDVYQISMRAVYMALCAFGILFGAGCGWILAGRVLQ